MSNAWRDATRSSRIAVAAVTLLLGMPLTALGQGSQLGMLVRAQANRYEGKEFYVERLKGLELVGEWEDAGDGRVRCKGNCIVYKLEDVYAPDGTAVSKRPRVLSATEVAVLAGTTPGSDVMRLYGAAMMDVQVDVNRAVTGAPDPTGGILRTEMYRAGVDVETDDSCYPSDFEGALPEGASRCPPDRGLGIDPWMDPFALIYAGGAMVEDASEGLREAEESLATSAAQAQEEANKVAMARAQFVARGAEQMAGRRTNRYTADPLDLPVQEVDGQRFELNRATLWVDPEDLVLVKHRFEGTATVDGESREFFIEVVNSDFRNPPGCGEMYEPYRRVQRMGGILDEAQMARVEEAKQQLEEFDRQMASVPAEQREMMERMMGSQMEAVRNLADDGSIEHVQEIEEILCDPDLKELFGVPGMDNAMPNGLLAQIQRHLVALGYEPGNTDGVLDPMTRSAISRYQTEHDLPVTGEPSTELAIDLAEEVEALDRKSRS